MSYCTRVADRLTGLCVISQTIKCASFDICTFMECYMGFIPYHLGFELIAIIFKLFLRIKKFSF